jgi:hypothetical protein
MPRFASERSPFRDAAPFFDAADARQRSAKSGAMMLSGMRYAPRCGGELLPCRAVLIIFHHDDAPRFFLSIFRHFFFLFAIISSRLPLRYFRCRFAVDYYYADIAAFRRISFSFNISDSFLITSYYVIDFISFSARRKREC